LANEADTDRLGAILAGELPSPCVVGLTGTLGAGKTRLVRAMVAGAGLDASRVQSPTFVLCHEYHGSSSIYHLDTYRLKDVAEFIDLGAEEYFEQPGWTLIEWADRVRSVLPAERLEVDLQVESPSSRQVVMTGYGASMERVVHRAADRYECGCDEARPARPACRHESDSGS
jgi:tRNA threonylcarbamoyladenosine biosynthesis protein TsaE